MIRPNDSSSLIDGPDLGPNCLQKLSADITSRQRVKLMMIYQLAKIIQLYQHQRSLNTRLEFIYLNVFGAK